MPHRIDEPSARPSQTRWREVQEVQSAITAGDLTGVIQAFSQWSEIEPADQYSKDFFICCLGDAISKNDASILSYLLSQEVPFNHSHIKFAVEKRSTSLLQAFLDNGWNINEPASESTPPLLSEAIQDGDLTKWFLENGANPDAECGLDYTPLSVAVARAPLSTIELLFENGGTTQHGQLLHYAAIRKEPQCFEVFTLLLSKGATGINDRLHQHRPADYEMYKSTGLGTPLHIAAEVGLYDTVKYLLDHGADCSMVNSRGKLAKDCALYAQHFEVVELLSSASSE